jgi:arylsulfatase A-like enzyme
VRVPLLVRWPAGLPAGVRSDVCASTVDLAPTLAAMLGLEAPDEWEGTDLTPAARGDEAGAPQTALLQGMGPVAVFVDGYEWRAVRTATHTYATYRADGAEHLFDHQADPYQLHDLVDDPACADVLATLRTALRERMHELGDTFEAATWYEQHWTDGERNIVAGARGPFPDVAEVAR